MSEVPADILDAAARLALEVKIISLRKEGERATQIKAIASALLAERERCAQVASEYDSLAAQAIRSGL